MGRALRWLKLLFGIHKPNENPKQTKPSSFRHSSQRDRENTDHSHSHNLATITPNLTLAEAAWLKSFYDDEADDTEENKHAIAVAAATAAAADAAVAAAQAAVEVVRLTSHGRATIFSRQALAAVKIQACFRGFLARKALRALRGLVKLQALVRGCLVRKQTYATLHGMEALIRAQTNLRAQNQEHCPPQFQPRKSLFQEYCNDSRVEYKNTRHRRRLSCSFEAMKDLDECDKIVEVDTERPKSRSGRNKSSINEYPDEPQSHQTSRNQPRLSVPESRNYHESDCKCSTTQSTPRFAKSCSSTTPSKGDYVDGYGHSRGINGNFPGYMANTKSFNAKVRSQSVPKQRSEQFGAKRRLSLNDMMESRSSLSGLGMQRSCWQAQEVVNFRDKDLLSRSSDFVNVQHNYFS